MLTGNILTGGLYLIVMDNCYYIVVGLLVGWLEMASE